MSNEDLVRSQFTFTVLDHAPFGVEKYINLKQQSGNTNMSGKNG
jgi:hypothetical protein